MAGPPPGVSLYSFSVGPPRPQSGDFPVVELASLVGSHSVFGTPPDFVMCPGLAVRSVAALPWIDSSPWLNCQMSRGSVSAVRKRE